MNRLVKFINKFFNNKEKQEDFVFSLEELTELCDHYYDKGRFDSENSLTMKDLRTIRMELIEKFDSLK